MGNRTEKAVDYHKQFHTCSGSVLGAFADRIGISEAEADTIARPFAGGRMGKCGAVMAAEYVLQKMYGEEAEGKIAEFDARFIDADKGSLLCSDLRGKRPGSCRACVTDAARILEEMIG